MGSQEIFSKHGPTGYVEIVDTKKFETSIDKNLYENGDSMPNFSRVIRRERSQNPSSDIYLLYRVDFMGNAVGTEPPDLMHLGLMAVNASDELSPFCTPDTRSRQPADGYHWSAPVHVSGEVTAVGMRRTRSEQNYSYKTDFETRK